jgi:hypothetical protein
LLVNVYNCKYGNIHGKLIKVNKSMFRKSKIKGRLAFFGSRRHVIRLSI